MKQLQRQLKVLGVADTANVDQVDAAYQTLRSTWSSVLESGDRAQRILATQRLEALEDAYRLVRPFASPVNGDDWADRMAFMPPLTQPSAATRPFTARAPPPQRSADPTTIDARPIVRSILPPEPPEREAPSEDLAAAPAELPAYEPSVEEVRDILLAARLQAKQRRQRQASLRWRKDRRLIAFILLLPGLVGVPALMVADAWHQYLLRQHATAAVTSQR